MGHKSATATNCQGLNQSEMCNFLQLQCFGYLHISQHRFASSSTISKMNFLKHAMEPKLNTLPLTGNFYRGNGPS